LGDESVLAVRVWHNAPGGDACHRVHVLLPVETLSEESQVLVPELLSSCVLFCSRVRRLCKNQIARAFVDALEFSFVDLGLEEFRKRSLFTFIVEGITPPTSNSTPLLLVIFYFT
jgi:hypothetical protein